MEADPPCDECHSPWRTAKHTCNMCHRMYYCSRRCAALAWVVGGHSMEDQGRLLGAHIPPNLGPWDADERRNAANPNADAMLIIMRRAIDNDVAESVSGHAPPHVWSWRLDTHPSVVAIPVANALHVRTHADVVNSNRHAHVLLQTGRSGCGIALLPRLTRTAFVLMGGTPDSECVHPAPPGHPERVHRFIGRAFLSEYGGPSDEKEDRAAMCEWCHDLGVAWAQLHYVIGSSGWGAAVIIGTPYDNPTQRARLFIAVDGATAPARSTFDVEQFASAMLMLPLIPEKIATPDLYMAFAEGYMDKAGDVVRERDAQRVLDALVDWT